MGAKQSSPAANGRTRAYSGSDLPSNNVNGGSGRTAAVAMRYHPAHGASGATSSPSSSSSSAANYQGSRTRSTGGPGARPQSSINIPSSGAYSSQESGNSTPEENGGERERSTGTPRLLIGSLPAHLSPHLFAAFVISMLTDGLEWCGLLVDDYDVFISCLDSHSDGTHSHPLVSK
ncbi:E3 ubiquitin-protein ligase znrf2 isoform X2 [Labeo rohita]|uniref:E3 ubiquitin-protein ligase znrf2 isoform X2 n=1 Tax=Labeo rohita TaxID=84645 RepID=UPI0021E320B4|nr:E3 ubiquitin-protein ligase znrf2 isoform X2 [Labeo rohita]